VHYGSDAAAIFLNMKNAIKNSNATNVNGATLPSAKPQTSAFANATVLSKEAMSKVKGGDKKLIGEDWVII
jgi:hypothetical protein